jgi:hypothetical protein
MIKNNIYIDNSYSLRNYKKALPFVSLRSPYNKLSTLDNWTFEIELKINSITGTFFVLNQIFTAFYPIRIQWVPSGPQLVWRDNSDTLRFLGNSSSLVNNKLIVSFSTGFFAKNIVNGTKTSNLNTSQCTVNPVRQGINELTICIQENNLTFFDGNIKNIRFFNESLDNTDEDLLYNDGNFLDKSLLPNYLKDNIVFEYKCNQQNGQIVLDTSGKNNNGLPQSYGLTGGMNNGNAWQPI